MFITLFHSISAFVVVQHFPYYNSFINCQLNICVIEVLFIASWVTYLLYAHPLLFYWRHRTLPSPDTADPTTDEHLLPD